MKRGRSPSRPVLGQGQGTMHMASSHNENRHAGDDQTWYQRRSGSLPHADPPYAGDDHFELPHPDPRHRTRRHRGLWQTVKGS